MQEHQRSNDRTNFIILVGDKPAYIIQFERSIISFVNKEAPLFGIHHKCQNHHHEVEKGSAKRAVGHCFRIQVHTCGSIVVAIEIGSTWTDLGAIIWWPLIACATHLNIPLNI